MSVIAPGLTASGLGGLGARLSKLRAAFRWPQSDVSRRLSRMAQPFPKEDLEPLGLVVPGGRDDARTRKKPQLVRFRCPVLLHESWHSLCTHMPAGGLHCPASTQRHQAIFSLEALLR
jgi:hypothetical protein